MRGRCFDVQSNKWKTVTPLTASSVHVHFAGFAGYTGTLREQGWDFLIVENHFTKRKKLRMLNSALNLVGQGDFTDGAIVFIRCFANSKAWGQERAKLGGELIDLDKVEYLDLLNAIASRQQAGMPIRPKPQAQIIKMGVA